MEEILINTLFSGRTFDHWPKNFLPNHPAWDVTSSVLVRGFSRGTEVILETGVTEWGYRCVFVCVVVVWKKMVPIGSDTIRRCGFVGIGVALLEEVCHCEGGLWGLIYAQTTSRVTIQFLLPEDQDVELWIPSPAPCLPAWYYQVPPWW